MTSFISPSSAPLGTARRGAMGWLLAALLFSYLLAALYSLWINPEVRFWKEAYKRKIEWARMLAAQGKPKLVFIGGSSTAFQIDASMLTEAGIPSVNMGMHAGMGIQATAAFGLSAISKGDTIIWSFEKDRLTRAPELDPLGYQALIATGVLFGSGPERLALQNLQLVDVMNAIRPGLDHSAVMLAKVALGYPLYRYKKELIRPGGAITTDERRPMPPNALKETVVEKSTLVWISSLNKDLYALECSTAYLISQSYIPKDQEEIAYDQNRRFLADLNCITTIIPDPAMGIQTNIECFADTPSHLRFDSMEERTWDLIPLLIKTQRVPMSIGN